MQLEFEEVKADICKNNLFNLEQIGTASTGEALFLSAGIKRFHAENPAPVQEALEQFLAGNYGTFYSYGEQPQEGREFGEYGCSYGAPIMIHRENYSIKIYFQFER